MLVYIVHAENKTPVMVGSIDAALDLAREDIYFNDTSRRRYRDYLRNGSTVHVVYGVACTTITVEDKPGDAYVVEQLRKVNPEITADYDAVKIKLFLDGKSTKYLNLTLGQYRAICKILLDK